MTKLLYKKMHYPFVVPAEIRWNCVSKIHGGNKKLLMLGNLYLFDHPVKKKQQDGIWAGFWGVAKKQGDHLIWTRPDLVDVWEFKWMVPPVRIVFLGGDPGEELSKDLVQDLTSNQLGYLDKELFKVKKLDHYYRKVQVSDSNVDRLIFDTSEEYCTIDSEDAAKALKCVAYDMHGNVTLLKE